MVRTEPRNGFAEPTRSSGSPRSPSRTRPTPSPARSAPRTTSEVDADAVTDVREEKGYGVVARTARARSSPAATASSTAKGVEHTDCDAEGTVVYVAVDGTYAGYIVIADELKPDAARRSRR